MPGLVFLAAVGLAIVVLLFVADAKLENVSPIVTSDRIGLPEPWHPAAVETPVEPAPASDAAFGAVLNPGQAPEARLKIEPSARAARAQAPPKKRQQDGRQSHSQQTNLGDRFSIRGQ